MFHINLQPVVGWQCEQDGGEKGLRVQPYLCTVMVLGANKTLHHSYSQHVRAAQLFVVRKSKSADKSQIKVTGVKNIHRTKTCLLWKDVSYIRAAPCRSLSSVV